MNTSRLRTMVGALVVGMVAAGTSAIAEAQRANIIVSQTDSADPVNVGTNYTYSITVRNEGPDSATNVMMTDTLPPQVAFLGGGTNRGSCTQSMGTISCMLGTIPAGASASITAVVMPLQVGTVTNIVRAQATEMDPFPTSNSDSEFTQIQGSNIATDIHVGKSASPSPAEVGQTLTYTITIQNLGPTAATNLRVVDRLPPGVTFDSASASCQFNNGFVTCFIAALASGATTTRMILVTPNQAGTITNNVVAAAPQTDPVTANNSGSVTTTVTDPTAFSADLSIMKSSMPMMVQPNGFITYTLTIANRGPDDTVNVVVTDTLPANVTFISANGARCNATGRTVTCDVGDMNIGDTDTITIVVRAANQSGVITNTATIKGEDPDPVDANNTSSVNTGVGVVVPPDGGVILPDAGGMVPDGGVVRPDAGPTPDGGGGTVDGGKDPAEKYDVRGAGCGCHTSARSGGELLALLLAALLGLTLALRSRR